MAIWWLVCDDIAFNSLKVKISGSVIFLTTAMGYPEGDVWKWKNPSKVFEIYERLFELKQEDKSVLEFYGELKSLIDELEMYQLAVIDAATLREYRQDLTVSKFLYDLSPSLQSQVRS